MIRLTRAGEYAVRGLVYLAGQSSEKLTLISEIARAENVSASFLAKIFQNLARAGMVKSHRGVSGGVSLAVSPEQITLRQIIEAVEGPIALNKCLKRSEACSRAPVCKLSPFWREAQAGLLGVLEATTLGKLNGNGGVKRVPPAAGQ
jgi:Rrf2 family protein